MYKYFRKLRTILEILCTKSNVSVADQIRALKGFRYFSITVLAPELDVCKFSHCLKFDTTKMCRNVLDVGLVKPQSHTAL